MSQKYTPTRHGEADYNRFTTIPPAQVPEGADGAPRDTYFAEMVHVVASTPGSSDASPSNPSLSAIGSDVLEIDDIVKVIGVELTIPETALIGRIAFRGPGDIQLTYDGTTPDETTGAGEIWYPGGLLTVAKLMASAMKIKQAGTTNSKIYVTWFA